MMQAEMVVAMQNVQGRLIRFLNAGDYAAAASLFSRDDAVSLQLDNGRTAGKGAAFVDAIFSGMAREQERADAPRCFYFLCTPAFRAPDAQGRFLGMWELFSFRFLRDGSSRAVFSVGRMDAEFVREGGALKYKRLSWLTLMSMEPWTYDPREACALMTAAGDVLRAPEGPDALPDDFVAIQRVAGRFAHNDRAGAQDMFLPSERTMFAMENLFQGERVGYTAIMETLRLLDERTAANGGRFACVPYLSAPVIVSNGDALDASWLVMSFDFAPAPTGEDETRSAVTRRLGCLNAVYVRDAQGAWRAQSFALRVLASFPPVYTLPKLVIPGETHRDNWPLAPEPAANAHCAADVFEIETLLAEWTGRLKTGRLSEFADSLMPRDMSDMVLQFSHTYYGEKAVREHLAFCDEEYRLYPREPSTHMGTTPVIEVSADGQRARAAWLDNCYTSRRVAFHEEDSNQYMCNICKYTHEFIREDGIWKLSRFLWAPAFMLSFVTFDRESSEGWAGETGTGDWPGPFEDYRPARYAR